VSGSAGAEPPEPETPRSFQGWQRGICVAGVGLLLLFAILVVITAGLGAMGVR